MKFKKRTNNSNIFVNIKNNQFFSLNSHFNCLMKLSDMV